MFGFNIGCAMSRSRKKTPIVGNTTVESDKWFKASEHRRERSEAKIALAHGLELPHAKAYGNPAKSGKDGKHYWRSPLALRK